MRSRFLLLALPLLVLPALAACQDSEAEAERFFRSGLELREEGDLDRAVVEFRNVFRHDGAHLEARRNLAEIQLERGEVAEAYSQYLRLAEQYPDDASVRAALARIAIEQRQWTEARASRPAGDRRRPGQPGLPRGAAGAGLPPGRRGQGGRGPRRHRRGGPRAAG